MKRLFNNIFKYIISGLDEVFYEYLTDDDYKWRVQAFKAARDKKLKK